MKPSEKRQYPRAHSTFIVEYTAGDRKFRHSATNLGGGGLFILAPQALIPGTELILRFRPSKHLPVLRIKGKVRFNVPGEGFGVEFKEISLSARNTLLRLIHHRTASRRQLPRVPLVTQIEYGDNQSLALVKDISVGGMFIQTREPPPAGSQIHLRFNLTEEGNIIQGRAEVAYCVEMIGMGVRFVEVEPGNLKRIQDYIAQAMTSKSS